MSIQPYVLESLYRQGSIDYVPYDALTPIAPAANYSSQGQLSLGLDSLGQTSLEQNTYGQTQSNLYGSTQSLAQKQMQELQRMSQGPITLYPKTQQVNINSSVLNNYNSSDTFSYSNSPLGEMSGSVVAEIRNVKSQQTNIDNSQDSIRASLITEDDKKGTQKSLESAKIWPKAFISLTAIGLTIYALFRGGKAIASSGSSFWSKLNPKNWF